MRLPRISPEKPDIDYATAEKQIARAMEVGLNYFDTAYFYHNGLSEKCAGDLLTEYPRDSYYLVSKMPVRALKNEADVERIWNEQLARCKADYFDFYLVHNLNKDRWEDTKRFHVYEFLKKKQEEGKIRKLGFSFHDEPETLKVIAEAYPWDFAQIQLNYLDWTLYRSKEQYELLTKLGIPVVIMEPLRGGALATLNKEATEIFKQANPDVSVASWALRYAASLPNVLCVLSGMTLTEHLEDNIRTFTDFKPLTDAERKTVEAALAAYRKSGAIPCTECRYCTPCPVGVDIPRIFGLYNQYKTSGNFFHFQLVYDKMTGDEKASACVNCGVCLKKCPQKIDIPEQLKTIETEFKQAGGRQAMFWTPNDERYV
ncbi:MAG: aldo/keto reductase [Lentisphaeria bacterium]|nr:aldo/keto reductase [Lentisphaeria bacterium]